MSSINIKLIIKTCRIFATLSYTSLTSEEVMEAISKNKTSSNLPIYRKIVNKINMRLVEIAGFAYINNTIF